MKLLYKPFALIAGLIGAKLGQSIFKQLWVQIDDSKPPKPTTAEASVPKVVAAAALEAATLAGVAAAVDRLGARVFEYLTGFWPGDRRAEPPDSD
jgi:Protein of unknown function (DUF4235)